MADLLQPETNRTCDVGIGGIVADSKTLAAGAMLRAAVAASAS
jgi:hypothetical protein